MISTYLLSASKNPIIFKNNRKITTK